MSNPASTGKEPIDFSERALFLVAARVSLAREMGISVELLASVLRDAANNRATELGLTDKQRDALSRAGRAR